MKFDKLWGQVAGLKMLPNEALRLVPGALSPETKSCLSRTKPEEAAEIAQWAIDQINHGSVETMEALVKRRL